MATPAELVENARCLECIPDGQKLSVLVYLFATIAGVPADAQSLVESARCIDGCIPPGMRLSVLVSLADTIATNAAAAEGQVTCGAGAPTATPTHDCAIYYDTNNDAFYIWRGGAWQLKV